MVVGVVILVLLVDVVCCLLFGLFVCLLFCLLYHYYCCCYGMEIRKEINSAGASEVIHVSMLKGKRGNMTT